MLCFLFYVALFFPKLVLSSSSISVASRIPETHASLHKADLQVQSVKVHERSDTDFELEEPSATNSTQFLVRRATEKEKKEARRRYMRAYRESLKSEDRKKSSRAHGLSEVAKNKQRERNKRSRDKRRRENPQAVRKYDREIHRKSREAMDEEKHQELLQKRRQRRHARITNDPKYAGTVKRGISQILR